MTPPSGDAVVLRLFGIWYGGNGYSVSSVRDLELFPNIPAAEDALYDRLHDGYHWFQTFQYVTREPESVFLPAVQQDSRIELYFATTPEQVTDQSEADKVVYFTPSGRILCGSPGSVPYIIRDQW